QDNDIDNLKSALKAVLPSFNVNSIDLTQLVHGLCLFMGYPSCVCSLKANVNESLKKISGELKEDSKAVQSCLQKTLNLNCNSCDSKEILCKCCVIRCIKELPGQSKCPCLSNTSKECECQEPNGKCCKDFLSGLEACLSLLNLKTDLKDCNCDGKTCCETGTCTNKSCPVCDPSKSTITGLGLSRPNPVRLAKRLNEMLCGTRESGQCLCGCDSGASPSCCCFCHKGCTGGNLSDACSKACPGCSCASKPGECPRHTFCKSINTIKVLVGSTEMTCCSKGADCHCVSDSGSKACTSGSNCCVVSCSTNGHYQHSVKCMILRVVKFFASFDASSPSKCSKLCCELICVGKYCYFLWDFYNKGNKEKCGTCAKKGNPCKGSTLQSPAPSNNCCNGTAGCKSGDCCQGCQDCDAIKFRKALQDLKYSSPCGQELYRVLDAFLYYCFNVFMGHKDFIRNTVLAAVKDCSNCGKSGPPRTWQACGCSSSSSCTACPKLLKDSKLMSILRHGYSSAYSEASWTSLTSSSSGSKCCCGQDPSSCSKCSSSGCSSNPSSCDPSKCCPDCPQRKAAKIFLGMLPCLYYGLKIVYDHCKYGSDFPDWSLQNISQGSIGKFLTSWGYDVHPLKSKNASDLPPILDILYGSGKFKSLLDFVSKKYFSIHVSDASKSPSQPKTVRQMLLWLYGLRFQKHFSDLVENCKSLCSPFGNSFNADAFCYYIHTCCFILPVAIISTIETSDSAQNVFSSSSEISKFLYPSDPSALADMFFDYIRKIYTALTFLKFQCERITEQGGWQDCAFGQSCVKGLQSSSGSPATSASSSCCAASGPKGYLCASIPYRSNYHEHCINGKTCIGLQPCTDSTEESSKKTATDAHTSGKCKESCPHPLMRFLLDGSESSDSQPENSQKFRTPFGLPGITPMGFSSEKLPASARDGLSLHYAVKVFCDSGFYPLTRLVQFILCVSQRPPETLLDLYAFFVKFKDSDVFKNDFASYASGEPGTPDGQALQDAIQNLYGSHSSGDHSVASLFSLSSCHANKGSNAACGAYLFPLTNNVAGVFTPELCSMYLSWICYRAEKFYSEFQKFHTAASTKFSCCKSSCQKIVECPCALPFLYSQGFTFMSPSGLNCVDSWGQEHKGQDHNGQGKDKDCTLRSCSQFITQLGHVANGDLFTKLLKEIDNFLWSIRFPFFFGFLYVWFFVLSYFCYVILIKLDTVHTGSHLHLPRSFKILPSTLFSDASSKLKDLSYFTL
ncbi:variant erythrocyte surface antigen-1 family protein, partial [Babesia divergens]